MMAIIPKLPQGGIVDNSGLFVEHEGVIDEVVVPLSKLPSMELSEAIEKVFAEAKAQDIKIDWFLHPKELR